MNIQFIFVKYSQILAAVLILMAPVSYGNSLSQQLESIVSLLNQQQYQQAYQMALTQSDEFEGEPSFDYVFGLTAQAVKQYHLAIFSFERVVKNQPSWLKARYALATSYYAAGNLAAAKTEFLLIQQQDKAKEFPLVTDYLAKVESRLNQSQGHWQHQFRLGFGHDDNANSGIEDEQIDTPIFGAITVFESSQPIEDQFVLSYWQSFYNQPINLNTRWYALAGLRNSHYLDYDDMDRNYFDAFAGWQSRWQKVNYHINGFYRPIWLDGEHYLSYYGLQAEFDHDLAKTFNAGASISLGQIDYKSEVQQSADKQQWLLALWLEQRLASSISRLTLHGGEENTDSKGFDYLGRDYYGVQYRYSYLVNNQLKLTATLDYGRSDYQAAHPLFLQTRKDTLKKLGLDVFYQYDKSWSVLAKVSAMKNDSELALYQYDRTLAWFALQYQF